MQSSIPELVYKDSRPLAELRTKASGINVTGRHHPRAPARDSKTKDFEA